MRLFVAIEVPPEIRAGLVLAPSFEGAKPTRVEQIHLTLRFIGEVGELGPIRDQLAGIAAAPFALTVGGAGVFPSPRSPRILWAQVSLPPELLALKQAIDAAIPIPIPDQDRGRPYHPHLTVARLKEPRPAEVQAALQRLGALRFAPFEVDHFALFSSRPGRDHYHYAVEATFPLQRSDG